jgi:aryl-alcohol dehydrogenase-like predicted oxidoreductase
MGSFLKSKIALGSAQFGDNYGIANKVGKVSQYEVVHILQAARNFGINTIDTAISYGDSEISLGSTSLDGFDIITKLPQFEINCSSILETMRAQITESLRRLGIKQLYGLHLHNSADLLSPMGNQIYYSMEIMKDEGLVKKIGVSIYDLDEIKKIHDCYKFDIVQIPLNILNNIFLKSGWIYRLKRHGVEIHARSIFLQGVLLLDFNQMQYLFPECITLWRSWHAWLRHEKITALEACLGFALSIEHLDKVIVGIDSLDHLQGICSSIDNCNDSTIYPQFDFEDIGILDPRKWVKK